MPLALALILLISMTTPATTNSQTATSSPQTNQSAEVTRLQAEIQSLKDSEQVFRRSEDKWDRRNRTATIVGVVVGGIVALGFGFAVWLSSSEARNAVEKARPLAAQRESKEARIRKLLDDQAEAKTQDATTAAMKAKKDAAVANRKAQHAILEQTKLQNANLQLQATIEQERTARVQLLSTIAYRALNVGELGQIRRATYAYREVPLDILYVASGDPEVGHFAASIQAAFNIWKPNVYPISFFLQRGLTVAYDPSDQQATEAAQHFFDALNHHGFRVNGPFPELPWTPKELLVQAVPQAKLRLIVGERDPVYLPPELRK